MPCVDANGTLWRTYASLFPRESVTVDTIEVPPLFIICIHPLDIISLFWHSHLHECSAILAPLECQPLSSTTAARVGRMLSHLAFLLSRSFTYVLCIAKKGNVVFQRQKMIAIGKLCEQAFGNLATWGAEACWKNLYKNIHLTTTWNQQRTLLRK